MGDARALLVDPAARTVLVGASGGLFRADSRGRLQRVGAAGRDVTALAIGQGGALLGSGHPAPQESGPSDAGLLRSRDGGRTWRALSLSGQAELRLLRPARGRLYALDATTGSLMAGPGAGRRWTVRSTPPGITDLAVDPADREHLLATSTGALWRSGDGARHWERVNGPSGPIAWSGDGRVRVASDDARLHESTDGGATWHVAGQIPAPLVALADGPGRVYGLLSDGTVLATGDERRWDLVARP